MTLYQKVLSVFGMLRNLINQKAPMSYIASEFSPSQRYDVDRLTIYEGGLYRCIVQHQGAWNPAHFSYTTLDQELSMKGSGGGSSGEDLYIKDGNGNLHKVTIEESDGIYTLAVDQEIEQ